HPELPQLALDPSPTVGTLVAFVRDIAAQERPVQENGTSMTSAVTPSPTMTAVPGGASRLTSASAIQPNFGDCATLPTRPTSRSPKRTASRAETGPGNRSPRR